MIVKQNLSTLIWANPSKKDKNGLLPIYARITIDGLRAEISLGKKIAPEKWDKTSSQVIGKDVEAKALNNFFNKVKSDLYALFLTLGTQHERVSPKLLSDKYTGKDQKEKQKTLMEIVEYHNAKFSEKVANGKNAFNTLRSFEVLKKKIQLFIKDTYRQNDMLLSNIKRQFVTDFEHFLMIKHSVGANTITKYIKMLKKIMNVAVFNEWIVANPFTSFKCTYTNPIREVLTQDELYLLWNKPMPKQKLERAKDIFVFACYTGYAFSDVLALTSNSISRGIDGEVWIKAQRTKTDVVENVMLLDIPLQIIEKYKNEPICVNKNKLLPVISNQKYNAYLKEIATICNINKHLTSHIARHTFATTVTLANGISLESVSAMLGHKSIRTTQIYAKVVQSKLSNEMKLLKAKLNPISTNEHLSIAQ